ncbi:uncharacterized protein LOC106158378 [Lingula anatina]|uniref:Uncharacterized protein LOC106158378 n=1 Tax=Lingula anatina TaxID=7574 RepID=A0A1S3HW47_LINAN|nr:uncharacterized protein LOC106158378 [Lingula anatina]|eukprot:XP_013389771.1 uncharacterized protein LOC106158378 [Lingula anatina]
MAGLRDKVVLITGASGGIGAAVAVQFAKQGCRLALSGRNVDKLEETATKCREIGLSSEMVFLVPGDISQEETASDILEKTIEKFNQLDILVNNAGVFLMDTIENLDMANFDRVMNINFRAAVYLTHLAVPYLVATKGNVVNVSSSSVAVPGSMRLTYGVSKAALEHFTKSAALHLGPKQVRVNCISPGYVDTDILPNAGVDPETIKAFTGQLKDAHPIGRYGQPDDISEIIVTVASDSARFMTGAVVAVDGGLQLSAAF